MWNIYIQCLLCARKSVFYIIIPFKFYKSLVQVIIMHTVHSWSPLVIIPRTLYNKNFFVGCIRFIQIKITFPHKWCLFHTMLQAMCLVHTFHVRQFWLHVGSREAAALLSLGGTVTRSPRLRVQASAWQVQELNFYIHTKKRTALGLAFIE